MSATWILLIVAFLATVGIAGLCGFALGINWVVRNPQKFIDAIKRGKLG